MELLLTTNCVNVDTKDMNGRTPLLWGPISRRRMSTCRQHWPKRARATKQQKIFFFPGVLVTADAKERVKLERAFFSRRFSVASLNYLQPECFSIHLFRLLVFIILESKSLDVLCWYNYISTWERGLLNASECHQAHTWFMQVVLDTKLDATSRDAVFSRKRIQINLTFSAIVMSTQKF